MHSFARFVFMLLLLGMGTGLLIVTASNVRSESNRRAAMERERSKLERFLQDESAADRLRYSKIVVEDQTVSGDGRVLKTTFLWCPYAWDDQQNDAVPLPQRRMHINGDKVWVDGRLLEFPQGVDDTGYLKGVSICVFEHVYGADEKPDDASMLGPWGTVRQGYRPDPLGTSVLDRYVWEQIGEIVQRPAVAEHFGAKITVFPAVMTVLKPQWVYRVSIGSKLKLMVSQEEEPRDVEDLLKRMEEQEKNAAEGK